MTKHHANPQTQKLFSLVLRLRAKNASEHEVELAAHDDYPGSSPTIKSMRSRLKRLFLSPPQAFEHATRAYEKGKHMHEIIALVPKITRRGAHIGNVNGRGKRRKAVLPRLETLWKVASEADKQVFLQKHGLSQRVSSK